MPKGQRKQKQEKIDKKQFEELCKIQCTQEEICSVLGIDHKTLDSWCHATYDMKFSQVFKEKRQGGKASLRRMQWKLAEKNATMGIWLGKNYLEQKDNVQADNSEEVKEAKEIIVSIRKTVDDNENKL